MDHADNDGRPVKRQRLSPASDGIEDAMQSGKRTRQAQEPTPDAFTTDAREIEVGIFEFVSQDVKPFQAVLKKRYTDFLVNEILPSGEIVHLTDTSVPQRLCSEPNGRRQGKQNTDLNEVGLNSRLLSGDDFPSLVKDTQQVLEPSQVQPQNPTTSEISESDRRQLVEFLNETAVAELLQLFKAILSDPNRKSKDHPLVRTEFTSDRAVRGEVHKAIRRIFASKIESSTDQEGFLCLTAAKPDSRKPARPAGGGARSKHPSKLDWLERGGDYLHFSLYKENKDTMEVISFLTRQMKTSAKTFQFAGTKDRRAVTCQRVSAYRLDPERLVRQNSLLRGAAVGNFECKPYGLELGDLGGNEFILTLRECDFSDMSSFGMNDRIPKIHSAVRSALTNLSTQGFINYYGLQRFGTFSIRTDTIGLHLLKTDFRSACEAILHYNPDLLKLADSEDDGKINSMNSTGPHTGPGRDEIFRAKAIHLFQQTANAHKPLEILPRKFSAENQIMRHLARCPNDYIGALLAIPRNLRLMYVHAYQSLVWNRAASRRWQLFGGQVVEGDLVLVKEHRDKERIDPHNSVPFSEIVTGHAAQPSSTEEVDIDGEIIINPSDHDRSQQIDDVFDRARALTATEASSGKYSIRDIVLPLPGFDVLYPTNASGEFYKKFMSSEEGGGLDPYNMRRKHKDFSLSGGYRKMLAFIGKEFDVSVHSYKKDEEQFVVTDWEKIKAQMNAAEAPGSDGDNNSNDIEQKSKQSVSESHHQSGEKDIDAKMMDDDDEDLVTSEINPTSPSSSAPPDSRNSTAVAIESMINEEKDKVALVIKFQLGASQYATMALRELSRGGIQPYQPESGTAK